MPLSIPTGFAWEWTLWEAPRLQLSTQPFHWMARQCPSLRRFCWSWQEGLSSLSGGATRFEERSRCQGGPTRCAANRSPQEENLLEVKRSSCDTHYPGSISITERSLRCY